MKQKNRAKKNCDHKPSIIPVDEDVFFCPKCHKMIGGEWGNGESQRVGKERKL